MADSTITKLGLESAPTGPMGQKYLAKGQNVALRMWDEEPDEAPKAPASREYETVGYVISGQAEIHFDGQVLGLEQGDSWVVPAGASHTYKILAPFTAVEATSPPAREENRDQSTQHPR